MTKQKFYLETYGCSANVADGEIMAGLLKENSLISVEEPEKADVNIIVTCTVKTASSHRMMHRIKRLSSSNRPLVVAGCMPKTERGLIENINPKVSLLGPEDLNRTVETVKAAIKGVQSIHLEGTILPNLLFPRIRRNQIIGIVKISSGCLGNCTFCQVKIAKGELTSYSPISINSEVKVALKNGCKEIWLTSQDNGCYGKDIGTDLVSLSNSILSIKGDFKIRLGMMNPEYVHNMIDKLMSVLRDEKFFKFLHLPVQCGSNLVLKAMRRTYTIEDFINSVKRFRHDFPLSTLSTDIIVGYPTETEEDFQKTINLIKEIKPDIVNISKYGARPGTQSERMLQLDSRIVKARSKELHRIVQDTTLLNNVQWIGWRGKVLIDEKVRGAVVGRNFAYRPVIIKKQITLGKVLDIEVINATSACLVGKPT